MKRRQRIMLGWRPLLAHGVLVGMAAFVLLGAMIWVRQANEVPLGPQQTVITQNPKAGVHTRLENEVEAWKIKRTLSMVREMGAPWIVEYFPWAFSEPRRGYFDWRHADLVVDHANRQGLTVVARLGLVPDWARPDGTTTSYLDPEHYPDFARYAAAFAEHFRGRVQYVILWNEPNLSLEWGYRPPDAEAYVAMLQLTAQAVRAVNPDMVILAGALAPTTGDPTGELGMSDLAYLQAMYDAGAAPAFDALAVHSYGLTFPPDDEPDAEVINFRRVELLRQVMVQNGDAAKPVFITEAGWNDHPRWTRAVRPAQRIRYTIQAYAMAKDWPWVTMVAMWAFRYPWPERNVRDYYTFVDPDLHPKPIYEAVQQALREGEQP